MPDMTLAVLGENHVKEVLENLTADELEGFKLTLSEALHEYSTNTQAVEDGTYLQPARVSTHSPATGCTTLYMPSCSPAGMGCKGWFIPPIYPRSPEPSNPRVPPPWRPRLRHLTRTPAPDVTAEAIPTPRSQAEEEQSTYVLYNT